MKRGAILAITPSLCASRYKNICKSQRACVGFIDAPVSVARPAAQNAQLSSMCGGEPADFNRVKPVLDVYAKMWRADRRPGLGPAQPRWLTNLHRRLVQASPKDWRLRKEPIWMSRRWSA